MEVYAASRRDLANAIQSYNDNDSITFISAAKVQQNSETTKDKGQKRALERESRVRQSLMEGKLLWKRAEIASDYSDLNQGLYKQPGIMSEPAVQGRVNPQSDFLSAKVRQKVDLAMGESLNRSKFVENYRSPDWMKF